MAQESSTQFSSSPDTHEVFNQPEPLSDYHPFERHPALQEALEREGGGAFKSRVHDFARLAAAEIGPLGFEANEFTPRLRTHDSAGRRIDQVDYHPAYHRIMAIGLDNGLASLTWSGKPGGRVARSAMMFLHNQFEAGTMCPITMTHAVLPALRAQPDVAAQWEPRVLASRYDQRFLPAAEKHGVTLGMAMTEKQGGSDVRSNTTQATPLGEPGAGREYELIGHKWFCSAPMSDAFLALAQTEEAGLSCFLVPRFRPDGSVNPIRIMRLKDKLGNRSNASSEIEYPGTWAVMVGEPGRGVATIIRMVAETRLDCVIGSASLTHKAVVEAIHHACGREAFGDRLVRQPLMVNVLADLALESEASLALAMFLAGRFERASDDEQAERLARIATPIAKYWVCKRAVGAINEAQECLGGAGYIEESILPRLYREAPVNAIWEGSGNVQCLDMLRAAQRDPGSMEALLDHLERRRGAHDGIAWRIDEAKRLLGEPDEAVPQARALTENLALALQAVVLMDAESPVAEAFCQARLTPHGAGLYGNLPPAIDMAAIVERTFPS